MSNPTDVLTLDEARGAIRTPANVTAPNQDLQALYIPAVTTIVEDIIGPVVIRSFTDTFSPAVQQNWRDRYDSGPHSVLLENRPIASVTSVTEWGTVLTAGTQYTADLSSGMVYAGTSLYPRLWLPGIDQVVVVYTAGRCADTASVPANVKMAARLILAHNWQADQQGFRPDLGAGDGAMQMTPSGYAIPRRAYAYLEPMAITGIPSFA